MLESDVKDTWAGEFVDELAGVPNAAQNDQADTETMAILWYAQPPKTEARKPQAHAGSSAAGAIDAME